MLEATVMDTTFTQRADRLSPYLRVFNMEHKQGLSDFGTDRETVCLIAF